MRNSTTLTSEPAISNLPTWNFNLSGVIDFFTLARHLKDGFSISMKLVAEYKK